MNKTKLNTVQKTRIITQYQAGFTGAKLALKYGVSVSTIFNVLRDAKVTRRPPGPVPQIA